MLHGGGQLTQLGQLVLMDLVERDQHACAVLDEQVRQHLQLVTQAGLHHVPFDGVPIDPTDAQRRRHALHPALHSLRVKVAQELRQVLLGHPLDETRGGGLAHHQPGLLSGTVLDRVEHHSLPSTASAGVQRRASGRARAVLQRLDEILKH